MSALSQEHHSAELKRSRDIMDGAQDGESDTKRMRDGGEVPPSKVLHVRNLPADCTEQELVALCCPFGRVVNCLIIRHKNQGFVQMESEVVATQLLNYFNTTRAMIRGKAVYFQYSSRHEITTPTNNFNSGVVAGGAGGQLEQQNNILLVTVMNVLYPVTIDTLHRIFSKFGQIQKIVIFTKNGTFQSLVQFATTPSAAAARMELDGQNIYAGCCTLRIGFSNLPTLNVKFNNDKSRNFLDPSLPRGPQGQADFYGQDQYGAQNYGVAGAYVPQYSQQFGQSMGQYRPGQPGHSVIIASGFPEGTTPDELFMLFGMYGDVQRVKILYNKKDTALIQFTTPQHAETAIQYLNRIVWNGSSLKINKSKHPTIAMPRSEDDSNLTRDYANSPLHRYKVAGSKNYQHITEPADTLHLSNLQEDVTEEIIRDIFRPYGNVTNFKFFAKDKRMALVQMGSLDESISALIHLHNFELMGQNIRVSFSKQPITTNASS